MKSVKTYLKRKRLTNKWLAEKVGVSEAQISRILSGVRGASNQLLMRMAAATRIPLSRLMKENKADGRA